MPGIVCITVVGDVLCTHLPVPWFPQESAPHIAAEIRRQLLAAQITHSGLLESFDCLMECLYQCRAYGKRFDDFYAFIVVPATTVVFDAARFQQTFARVLQCCSVSNAAQLADSVSAFIFFEELTFICDACDPLPTLDVMLSRAAARDHFMSPTRDTSLFCGLSAPRGSDESVKEARDTHIESLTDVQFAFPDDGTVEAAPSLFTAKVLESHSTTPEPLTPPLAATEEEHLGDATPPAEVAAASAVRPRPVLSLTETIDALNDEVSSSVVCTLLHASPADVAEVDIGPSNVVLSAANRWSVATRRSVAQDDVPLKMLVTATVIEGQDGAELIVKIRWAWNPHIERCAMCTVQLPTYGATEVLTRPVEHARWRREDAVLEWSLIDAAVPLVPDLLAAKLSGIPAANPGMPSVVRIVANWKTVEGEVNHRRLAVSVRRGASDLICVTQSGDYVFTCSVAR